MPAFTLSTAARTDQEAFFKAVQAALPLDPPLKAVRRVGEALADSLWVGLRALNAPHVVIVWPDAHPVASAQGDFKIALAILREMVTSLAQAQYTGGQPTHVSLYIAPATGSRQRPGA